LDSVKVKWTIVQFIYYNQKIPIRHLTNVDVEAIWTQLYLWLIILMVLLTAHVKTIRKHTR